MNNILKIIRLAAEITVLIPEPHNDDVNVPCHQKVYNKLCDLGESKKYSKITFMLQNGLQEYYKLCFLHIFCTFTISVCSKLSWNGLIVESTRKQSHS